MTEIERRLREEKQRIDEQETPKELEDRLRSALTHTSNTKRRKPVMWKIIAAFFLAAILLSYNYPALAYYGKQILGFDEVVSGTLQDLNEAGKGQVIEESITLEKGVTFTVNGVITDENRLVLYYTFESEKGNAGDVSSYYQPAKLTGFLTNSHVQSGHGQVNSDGTELKGTFDFEPPSAFAKKLTLHFGGSEKTLEFHYDPFKALESRVVQDINQEVQVDSGRIKFESLTASPTQTVIKGTTNVKNLDQVMQPFGRISLWANGNKMDEMGRGVASSISGSTFELEFDALPQKLKSLNIKVDEFIGYEDLQAEVPLVEGTEVEVAGETVKVKQITVKEHQTEVTISTKESVTFDDVSLGNEPLSTTVGQSLKKKSNFIEKERTLVFETTTSAPSMFVGGMYYIKTYNEKVEITFE
ncbi:DUF4179 domain-containing protein [Salinibacillus xinjiangensis]|nr:DUF4179 domain-containing protein [Salinibacillus xinjiangensis]